MNFDTTRLSIKNAIKDRNIAIYAALIMGVSNVLLVGSLVTSEDKLVLVPMFNTDHRLSVSGNQFNDTYFIDWADSVLRSILMVNPDTVDWKTKDILKISSNSFGSIKKDLEEESRRVKENELSTVFYPKEFTVDRGKKVVIVKGQYIAYMGREKTPLIKDRIYELGWIINNQGIVLVHHLKDITQTNKETTDE